MCIRDSFNSAIPLLVAKKEKVKIRIVPVSYTHLAIVYGAYDKSKLVGFIWGYPRNFFDEKRIFINCLVVNKEYEKQGIGKKLINRLEDFAKENKYDSIDLTVAPFNENAVGFYNHMGFESERIQMVKKLGGKQ